MNPMYTKLSNFKNLSMPLIVTGLLALLSIALSISVTIGDPRISFTDLDENLINQSYTMHFSTTIKDQPTDVSIQPAIEKTVRYDNNKVIINFLEPLDYGTTYTLSLNVEDTRNKSGQIRSDFTTSTPSAYYLNRDESGSDLLRELNLSNSKNESQTDKIIFSHDTIIDYALSKSSIAVITDETDQQNMLILHGSTQETIILPEDSIIRDIDGSLTKNSYILALANTQDYLTTLWEYSVADNKFKILKNDSGEPVQTTEAQYAPDGTSVIYLDQNRTLLLDNFSDNRTAINFGSFDSLRRLLPNERAVFGYRKNKPTTLLAIDGSEVAPPKSSELSAQALLTQDLKTYLYLKQVYDDSSDSLQQQLVSFTDQERLLTSVNLKNSLILELYLSPNDQYILIEKSTQPVIFDNNTPNAKPKNVFTEIMVRDQDQIVMTIEGFNIKWR